MGFTMNFKAFEKTFFPLVEKKIPSSGEKGLAKAAFEMLRDADKEAPQTPKEFGDLRGSRKVEKPRTIFGTISIEAGYTSKYATRQHEAEPGEFNYTKDKGVTQPGPKFLQSKMVRHKKKYMEIVALVIEKTKV